MQIVKNTTILFDPIKSRLIDFTLLKCRFYHRIGAKTSNYAKIIQKNIHIYYFWQQYLQKVRI